MGLKTIKMKWDLCSSAPWVPFYPYTTFQNHTFLSKLQKTRITEKSTCLTKFSHSALQLVYLKTYMCRFWSLFKHFLPVYIDIFYLFFFFFGQGEFSKQAKISYFVDFDWEKHIEMVWVVHIQGLRHGKSNGAGFESLQ